MLHDSVVGNEAEGIPHVEMSIESLRELMFGGMSALPQNHTL